MLTPHPASLAISFIVNFSPYVRNYTPGLPEVFRSVCFPKTFPVLILTQIRAFFKGLGKFYVLHKYSRTASVINTTESRLKPAGGGSLPPFPVRYFHKHQIKNVGEGLAPPEYYGFRSIYKGAGNGAQQRHRTFTDDLPRRAALKCGLGSQGRFAQTVPKRVSPPVGEVARSDRGVDRQTKDAAQTRTGGASPSPTIFKSAAKRLINSELRIPN